MDPYEYIKNEIILGDLKQGTIFNEKEMANKLSTSRTPIREAVLKLKDEGYLIIIPRKGTIVSSISYKDIEYIYEYRLLLEPNIILELNNKVDETFINHWYNHFTNKLKQDYNFNNYSEDDDKLFHHDIVTLLKNPLLISQIDNIMDKCLRIRIQSNVESKERYFSSLEEHLELVNLLKANDLKKASNKMKEHLKNTLKGFSFIRN